MRLVTKRMFGVTAPLSALFRPYGSANVQSALFANRCVRVLTAQSGMCEVTSIARCGFAPDEHFASLSDGLDALHGEDRTTLDGNLISSSSWNGSDMERDGVSDAGFLEIAPRYGCGEDTSEVGADAAAAAMEGSTQ